MARKRRRTLRRVVLLAPAIGPLLALVSATARGTVNNSAMVLAISILAMTSTGRAMAYGAKGVDVELYCDQATFMRGETVDVVLRIANMSEQAVAVPHLVTHPVSWVVEADGVSKTMASRVRCDAGARRVDLPSGGVMVWPYELGRAVTPAVGRCVLWAVLECDCEGSPITLASGAVAFEVVDATKAEVEAREARRAELRLFPGTARGRALRRKQTLGRIQTLEALGRSGEAARERRALTAPENRLPGRVDLAKLVADHGETPWIDDAWVAFCLVDYVREDAELCAELIVECEQRYPQRTGLVIARAYLVDPESFARWSKAW